MNSNIYDDQVRFYKRPCHFYNKSHIASNFSVFDPNLTPEAFRLISALISFPDNNWVIWQEDVRNRLRMTKYTFNKAMQCAIKAGYIIKTQVKDSRGRFHKNNFEFDTLPIYLNQDPEIHTTNVVYQEDVKDALTGTFEPSIEIPFTEFSPAVNRTHSVLLGDIATDIEQTNAREAQQPREQQTAMFVCSFGQEEDQAAKLSLLEPYDLKMSSLIRCCKFSEEHIETALRAFEQWKCSADLSGETIASIDASVCKAVEFGWKPNKTQKDIEELEKKMAEEKAEKADNNKKKAADMLSKVRLAPGFNASIQDYALMLKQPRGNSFAVVPLDYNEECFVTILETYILKARL